MRGSSHVVIGCAGEGCPRRRFLYGEILDGERWYCPEHGADLERYLAIGAKLAEVVRRELDDQYGPAKPTEAEAAELEAVRRERETLERQLGEEELVRREAEFIERVRSIGELKPPPEDPPDVPGLRFVELEPPLTAEELREASDTGGRLREEIRRMLDAGREELGRPEREP